MALFHFHVTQVKRSAGQSIVTSAAYRAGEKLYSEYYGEVSDYPGRFTAASTGEAQRRHRHTPAEADPAETPGGGAVTCPRLSNVTAILSATLGKL